jgi:predicted alpha/beta-hydrolase family hydrolase
MKATPVLTGVSPKCQLSDERRAAEGTAPDGRLAPILDLETPHGLARARVLAVDAPVAALVLGHGAGGGLDTPELAGAAGAARAAGLGVALVEQPYRVAGRRSPAPARQLDAAWTSVVAARRAGPLRGLPILTGGRSSGARVACRTAADTGSVAVLCLAFPLHPPGRPGQSRLAELDAVGVPTLVVQGERDPFGTPPAGPGRTVIRVPGTHSLKSGAAVAAAVADWLTAVTPGGR